MFAHRSFVILFTKITMFPYSEQVQDIQHYGARVGDDFVAKKQLSRTYQMDIQCIMIINRRVVA